MGHYHAGIIDLVVENPSEECKKVLAYITMDERNYEKWGLDYYSLRELMFSGEIELSEEEQVIAGDMASSCLRPTLSFISIVETAWCGGSAYQEEYAFNKYDIVVGEDGVERHIITQAMSCKRNTGFHILARYLEPWLPKDGRCIMAFKYEDNVTWRAICQGIKETMVLTCAWDDDSDPKPVLSEVHEAKLNMTPLAVFGFFDVGSRPLDIDFEGDELSCTPSKNTACLLKTPVHVGLFNTPDKVEYLIAAKNLHDLAAKCQVSYALHYNEASNNWYGDINSAVESESFTTKDHMLSSVMELMIDHVLSILGVEK